MNLSDLLAQIEAETRNLPSDPTVLSDLLIRLASYYATLGPFVVQAWKEAEDAKASLKILQERTKLSAMGPEKRTAAFAESAKITQTETEQKDLIQKQYKYKLLQVSRENLETTIDAIRSKLTTARTEKETSRYAT